GDLGDLSVQLDHVGLEPGDVAVAVAPGDPGAAVVVGEHRWVDVLPAVLALGRHLVGDERRALRVHEWAGGRIRDGDADRLARVGVVVLHRRVAPVEAIRFDQLRRPGLGLGPPDTGSLLPQ